MNKKILTVSIAAYNMEKYIRNTLDSLLDERIVQRLEIFVVDDGGTDSTLEIAGEYAARYPDSVFPVHKENSGYGSTVNESISRASGRYFKCLDGDDWFDQEGLYRLILALETSDADIVVTGYKIGADESCLKEVHPKQNFDRRPVRIDDMKASPLYGMWELTYKTDILRKSGLQLPEHTLYTDQMFATIPFAYADTIQFLKESVYCYRIGRDGQSVSRESRVRHRKDALDNCARMCFFYEKKVRKSGKNKEYLIRRITKYYAGAIRTLFLCGITQETLKEVTAFERRILRISPELYQKAAQSGKTGKFIRLMRKTNYRAFWLLRLIPGGVPNWN